MKECNAVLGSIVNTVGLKGEIKLLPGPDFWSDALSLTNLDVVSKVGVHRRVSVEKFRTKGQTVIIKFDGVSSIDEAESLVGSTLEVALGELDDASLPSEILPCQAIGLEVRKQDGTVIGTVSDILLGSQQDCFIVQGEGRKYLVPFVPQIVKKVDLEGGYVVIDPPEGLLDLDW